MNSEIVTTLLTSLGGATVIVGALAHFLGKVWADRIANQALAKYDRELEVVKSSNKLILENFINKAEIELKEREQFSGISKEVYEEFFKKRVVTYEYLLSWKNKYISSMSEDFHIEESEQWGEAYYDLYISLRKLIIENQLYASNELTCRFDKLREAAAVFIKEGDLAESRALGAGVNTGEAAEDRRAHYEELEKKTSKLMEELMSQIDSDINKIRSRIEMDKV